MSFPKGDRLIVAEGLNNVNMTVGKTTRCFPKHLNFIFRVRGSEINIVFNI